MNILFYDCLLKYIFSNLTCKFFILWVHLFQCFLCLLTTLAIPILCSTPGVNIFTLYVYKRASPLWFVLNLKPEVMINGSDYFLAVSYWLSLSLISELLSQGDASRVKTGGGELGGEPKKSLIEVLPFILKLFNCECTWKNCLKTVI